MRTLLTQFFLSPGWSTCQVVKLTAGTVLPLMVNTKRWQSPANLLGWPQAPEVNGRLQLADHHVLTVTGRRSLANGPLLAVSSGCFE